MQLIGCTPVWGPTSAVLILLGWPLAAFFHFNALDRNKHGSKTVHFSDVQQKPNFTANGQTGVGEQNTNGKTKGTGEKSVCLTPAHNRTGPITSLFYGHARLHLGWGEALAIVVLLTPYLFLEAGKHVATSVRLMFPHPQTCFRNWWEKAFSQLIWHLCIHSPSAATFTGLACFIIKP